MGLLPSGDVPPKLAPLLGSPRGVRRRRFSSSNDTSPADDAPGLYGEKDAMRPENGKMEDLE